MRHRTEPRVSSSTNDDRPSRVEARHPPKKSFESRSLSSTMRRWLRPSRVVRRCACLHALLLCIYLCIPFVMRTFPAIMAKLVFQNSVALPLGNLSRPSEFNVSNGQMLFIPSTDGVVLGAWYIPAHGFPSSSFPSSRPIMLYHHGNTGNRGMPHRVELYHLLSQHGFDVIAFDYRGYGDSTNLSPSEKGVVSDSMSVFNWVAARSSAAIHMWGHSLGTGVATEAARLLTERGTPPRSLILEAPFNNLAEATRTHPLAKLYGLFPCFDWFFVTPLLDWGLRFSSDEHIVHVKAPVSIVHAKDDWIIPYTLGLKLYESARGRPASSGPVQLVLLDGHYGYGHKNLVHAPELVRVLGEVSSWASSSP